MATREDTRPTTHTEYEQEVARIAQQNINLKIRVAQLEEALENDTDAASDLGRPTRARGSEAGVDASEAPAALSMTVTEESLAQRRAVLDREWAAVHKLHQEVADLKADLELGRLPAEPVARRKAYVAKQSALIERVEALERDNAVLRRNNAEAHRLRGLAQEAADNHKQETEAERQRVQEMGAENARLHGLVAEAEAAASSEMISVAGGVGPAEQVVYLEKVLALERKLADQAETVRQVQRREGALAARACELERQLVERGRPAVLRADGTGHDKSADSTRLREKLDKKKIQLVKWKQEAVRCEQAKSALEAEVLDVRSLLLAEQRRRADADENAAKLRRQLAFAHKRLVRLEAELLSAGEATEEAARQMQTLKQQLDRYTVAQPDGVPAPAGSVLSSTRQDGGSFRSFGGEGIASHHRSHLASNEPHSLLPVWTLENAPLHVAWGEEREMGGSFRDSVRDAGRAPSQPPSPHKSPKRVEISASTSHASSPSKGSPAKARRRLDVVGARSLTPWLEIGWAGRSRSVSPSKRPRRDGPPQGTGEGRRIDSLATRVSMALTKGQQRGETLGEGFQSEEGMHAERKLQRQIEVMAHEESRLQAEVQALTVRLEESEQQERQSKRELEACAAKLARARQQILANGASLQMWSSLGGDEGGERSGGGDVKALRLRIGELETQCAEYLAALQGIREEKQTMDAMLVKRKGEEKHGAAQDSSSRQALEDLQELEAAFTRFDADVGRRIATCEHRLMASESHLAVLLDHSSAALERGIVRPQSISRLWSVSPSRDFGVSDTPKSRDGLRTDRLSETTTTDANISHSRLRSGRASAVRGAPWMSPPAKERVSSPDKGSTQIPCRADQRGDGSVVRLGGSKGSSEREPEYASEYALELDDEGMRARGKSSVRELFNDLRKKSSRSRSADVVTANKHTRHGGRKIGGEEEERPPPVPTQQEVDDAQDTVTNAGATAALAASREVQLEERASNLVSATVTRWADVAGVVCVGSNTSGGAHDATGTDDSPPTSHVSRLARAGFITTPRGHRKVDGARERSKTESSWSSDESTPEVSPTLGAISSPGAREMTVASDAGGKVATRHQDKSPLGSRDRADNDGSGRRRSGSNMISEMSHAGAAAILEKDSSDDSDAGDREPERLNDLVDHDSDNESSLQAHGVTQGDDVKASRHSSLASLKRKIVSQRLR